MTPPGLSFDVIGMPAPQGSKRAFVIPGTTRAAMVESSKAVKPWRQAVSAAARAAMIRAGASALDGPVDLAVTFYLPRPASLTKAKAAMGPCRKPDIDKLCRSTIDALVDAGVLADDARIVHLDATKIFVREGGHLGASIMVALATAPATSPSPGASLFAPVSPLNAQEAP